MFTKRKSFVLAFVLGALIAGTLLVDVNKYAPLVAHSISQRAKQGGIALTFSQPKLSYLAFGAESATILMRGLPLALSIERPTIGLSPIELFMLRGSLNFDADAYNGKLLATGTRSFLNDSILFNGKVQALDLSNFPPTAWLGITGKLNVDLIEGRIVSNKINGAKIEIEVNDCDHTVATKVDLTQMGVPFKIDLPPFSALNASIPLSFKDDAIMIEGANIHSSLFKLDGKGSIKLSRQTADISLDISLTDSGSKELGVYLPLISQGTLLSGTREFSIKFSGPLRRPSVNFLTLVSDQRA